MNSLTASMVFSSVRSRQDLLFENLALRHQLIVLQRQAETPKLKNRDRILWTLLSRILTGWQMIEAFPWDELPKYLIRDRDGAYGNEFVRRVDSMGIEQVVTSPRSPWQSAYVERVIGSIRRECLDHVIVFNARHLKRVPRSYFLYYHEARTHLGLSKDCPIARTVEPSGTGPIESEAMAGGLHHRYFRRAA